MDAFFETLKNLGPARLGVMMLTLLGLIVFFIFIAVRSSAPSMTLLYGELSVADSTAIAAQLDLARVPYRIDENGQEIMVPHQDIGKARMLLAQEGLPSNGTIGYEIFDQKQKFGQTSFVQNINQLRALEGELARTIRTLDSIRSARVHLVLPQRELFSRESRAASASVIVNMRGSQQMSAEQASAIQHLVASAVPKLQPENVALTDGHANLLAGGGKDSTFGNGVSGPDALRTKYEQRLTHVVEDMVSRIVGHGKVRANVTADLDFDVISRNSETYDPEGQVVRSTQTVEENDSETDSGNRQTVTVQNNLPGLPGGNSGGAGGSNSSRTEEVTNYEISRTVESIVSESGEVRKLSVAVLLDGYYETEPAVEGAEGGDDEGAVKKTYKPRSQEELDKIADLVKAAIGFDDTRGDTVEVVNIQFANEQNMIDPLDENLIFGTFEKQELLQFAETFMLSIVALLVVLLVLRPLVNHIAAASQSVSDQKTQDAEDSVAMLASQVEAQAQLAPPGSDAAAALESDEDTGETLDVTNVEGRVNASSVKKVSDLVDNHPSEAVSVIRSWMSQES